GIICLTNTGDAYIVSRTKVQACAPANPVDHPQPDTPCLCGILVAKQAFVLSLLICISHLCLYSVVLVISKRKGIRLVFKTDSLQNVDINSTFDSIAVIQTFIRHEIKWQLRQMFRDLPGIIQRLK
ncbi:hypothetical protein BJY52DRAFT_1127908, partial [Lactarius psammicola]